MKTATKTPNESENKTANEKEWDLWNRVLPEIKSIIVVGTTGSGKTALCWKVLDTAKSILRDREIYVLKHPNQTIVEKRGFKNMYSIEQIDSINHAVIYIDEPQTLWKLYDHKANTILGTILTLARQRDILLIISTAMTQWVSRVLEGQVDCWIIKDLDFDGAKQGSRVRNIIQQNSLIDPAFFRLNPDQYLFYCRKFMEYSGKHKFNKPEYFTDEYSKPYGNQK